MHKKLGSAIAIALEAFVTFITFVTFIKFIIIIIGIFIVGVTISIIINVQKFINIIIKKTFINTMVRLIAFKFITISSLTIALPINFTFSITSFAFKFLTNDPIFVEIYQQQVLDYLLSLIKFLTFLIQPSKIG